MSLGGLILDAIEAAVWIVAWSVGGIFLLVPVFFGWRLLRSYVLAPLAFRLAIRLGQNIDEEIREDLAKMRKRAEAL